jgi:hypothetical protein
VSSDDRNADARNEFQRSVERLEKAVQGFVTATNEHVTNRAAEFVDDTAERLERELRSRRGQRDGDGERSESKRTRRERYREARWERRSRRRHARWQAAAGTPGYRTARACVPASRAISESRSGWCAAWPSPVSSSCHRS